MQMIDKKLENTSVLTVCEEVVLEGITTCPGIGKCKNAEWAE